MTETMKDAMFAVSSLFLCLLIIGGFVFANMAGNKVQADARIKSECMASGYTPVECGVVNK